MDALEMNQPPFAEQEFNKALTVFAPILSSEYRRISIGSLQGFDDVALCCKVLDSISTQLENFEWTLESFTNDSITFSFNI